MGIGGKLFFSLGMLVFFCVGALGLWVILLNAVAVAGTWSWPKTDCEILSSRAAPKPKEDRATGDYIFEVKYRYGIGGQTNTSEQYMRDPQYFQNYSDVAKLVEKYPAGGHTACFVNPAALAEAILVRDNLFFHLLFLLFPLAFMGFGGAGLYAVWRQKPAGEVVPQPISDRAGPGRNPWIGIVVCLFFFLLGSGFLYLSFLGPLVKIVGARDWPAVPCVVISSIVDASHDSHGSTYSVNILYRYELQARQYESNTYDFVGGSSSGYDGKRAVVDQHPPGSQAVCYVNPGNPTEAVLNRGLSAMMLWGLLALVFVLIGGGGLYTLVRRWWKKESSDRAGQAQ
jgi:hypothetical protein